MISFCFVLIRNKEELDKCLLILNAHNTRSNVVKPYQYPFFMYIYSNIYTNLERTDLNSLVNNDDYIIDIERFISRY